MNKRKILGHDEERYRKYRAHLAPGTPLRDGLDRIMHGHTGALVVLGRNKIVDELSTGGFTINAPFTPTALRELAKMDGGIVLSDDLDQIVAAGVHFVPSGDLPTIETGTRHRTADRISQQSNVPVATVSASMSTIALFMSGLRYPIESSSEILGRADQALATLSRYRERLQSQANHLSGLELSDSVTVDDIVRVAQPVEMVRRLAEELEGYVEALGIDGRLLQLQLFELTNGLDQLATMIEMDYSPDGQTAHFSLDSLHHLATGDLLDPVAVARAIGLPENPDAHLTCRGYRLVNQAAQLPSATVKRLLDHFGGLQTIVGASARQLAEVEGITPVRARTLRDGIARIAEQIERG